MPSTAAGCDFSGATHRRRYRYLACASCVGSAPRAAAARLARSAGCHDCRICAGARGDVERHPIPPLLAAVCSAGVFGALVQSMRGIRDGMAVTGQKASVDAVLGLAAGFLTAALYMLAQIAITGELDLPVSNPDYSRVALVVSMAAVFASLYLDSAFSRFDGFKESVMSGTYGKKSSDG